MKKIKCHCGAVEAEVNITKLEKKLDVIAQFAKEREP